MARQEIGNEELEQVAGGYTTYWDSADMTWSVNDSAKYTYTNLDDIDTWLSQNKRGIYRAGTANETQYIIDGLLNAGLIKAI